MPNNEELNKNDDENSNSVPEVVNRALEEIPDNDIKNKVRKSISMSFSAMSMFGKTSPFENVINADHCTKMIENMDKADEREYLDKKSTRKYIFWTIVTGLLFLCFVIYVFLYFGKAEMIKDLIVPIITFLGGAWGGYGLGYKNCQNKNN